MQNNTHKKGFTLIEMLVVIAIIAILVAIVIPIVASATKKAKAATDAANLRSVLGIANTILVDENVETSAELAKAERFNCASFPGASAIIAYKEPGFIQAFYKDGNNYYSLEYFTEVAKYGESTLIASSPEEGCVEYIVGTGGR